jgi:putative transposase
MHTSHYTIHSRHVHDLARDRLQQHLALPDHGPKTSANTLYAVLLWAAAHMSTIASACASLRKAPSDQAIRNALAATLPEMAMLQKQINRALAGGLPKFVLRRSWPIALDLTLLPYYGQALKPGSKQLYKGASKAGTKTFHAYATAYLVCQGCRFNLGLVYVHHSDPWDQVVRDLLRQVRRAGVQIRYVLLDRGFYSVSVIRYLQAARYPFVMPAIRRGRKPDHRLGASGTWALTQSAKNRWVEYTLQEKRGKKQARVQIGVYHHHLPEKTRSGRVLKGRRLKVWLYAMWGLGGRSLSWVAQRYRERFGIETSYRLMNQVRGRTSSRCPRLRLLYVGLGLLLCNVWVWLHWEQLSYPRRGKRVVDLNQLPLRAMADWIVRIVEQLLGTKDSIMTQRKLSQAFTSINSTTA